MSILIKGMKMPKNCGECKFCRMTYTQYGEIFSADCTIKDFPIKWSELDLRDGLCPLVEIPPHGRLIDADALMDHKAWVVDAWSQSMGMRTEAVNVCDILNAPIIIQEGE